MSTNKIPAHDPPLLESTKKAYDHICPDCDAQPGERCTHDNGEKYGWRMPHFARRMEIVYSQLTPEQADLVAQELERYSSR